MRQSQVISAVADAVRVACSGVKDPTKPTAVRLFAGPTGTGKTELAKALAEFLFGSEASLLRFDMSEYMEELSVSKLIGSPPGYIGQNEGGRLTDAVRAKPYSVILFDEEGASPRPQSLSPGLRRGHAHQLLRPEGELPGNRHHPHEQPWQ